MNQIMLHNGDALTILPTLTIKAQTVLTSPPYYGSDIGLLPTTWKFGNPSALGAEETREEYIQHLVEICDEIKKVLTDDGIFWLIIGEYKEGKKGNDLLVSSLIASALENTGWHIASELILDKDNSFGRENLKTPKIAHDKIWMLTKSDQYRYGPSISGLKSILRYPYKLGGTFYSFDTGLVSDLLLASGLTSEDIVLDPFMGVGTVGRVCKDLNVKFCGIELNQEDFLYAQQIL